MRRLKYLDNFERSLKRALRAKLTDEETVYLALVELSEKKTLGQGDPWREEDLSGKLLGKSSIRIGEDCRIVFKRTSKTIVLIDCGSHHHLYFNKPRKGRKKTRPWWYFLIA